MRGGVALDFEEVYHLYFQKVYLFVRSLSKDEKVAEEIAQETFFKALKSLHQFDGTKDIQAWLFTIAKNTYFSHYKKAKREHISDDVDESTGVYIVQQLMDEEHAFIVHQFLHTMAEPYKEVFSLRVFGELSFAKIGLLFGKSEGWARTTFFRARKKIVKYLEGINDEQH